MKLKFVIDKKLDMLATKRFMPGDKEALELLKEQYKTSLKYLILTQKMYQESWDEINEEFSEYIEEITGYKWLFPEYICILSFLHPGLSNGGKDNIIVRYWKVNPYYMRRITAHELALSHYRSIYDKHFSDSNLNENQIWALAEIAAYALVSLTPQVNRFWPWDMKYHEEIHGYPEIWKLKLELKNIFLKRKNFQDYIKKGIELVRKYPDIGVKGGKK